MKPDKQRIAIAEACGYRNIRWWGSYGDHLLVGEIGAHDFLRIQDYPHDLNAMHQAEKVLPLEEHQQYVCWLTTIVMARPWSELDSVTYEDAYYQVHATAAQRAEAFLRTLGKWEAQ